MAQKPVLLGYEVKWACVCKAHEERRQGEMLGKRRITRRLNEHAFVCSGVCWKQFIFWRMIWFVTM